MMIITKDNYCVDYFKEEIVAKDVNPIIGEEIVDLLNDKHWNDSIPHYYALVEDDYELRDDYKDL